MSLRRKIEREGEVRRDRAGVEARSGKESPAHMKNSSWHTIEGEKNQRAAEGKLTKRAKGGILGDKNGRNPFFFFCVCVCVCIKEHLTLIFFVS